MSVTTDSARDQPLEESSANRTLKAYQVTVATMTPISGAIQNAVHLLARRIE